MRDPAIQLFFDERIHNKVEGKQSSTRQELEEQWLTNAVNRASSRAFTTHPSKFSHPSTGVSKDSQQKGTFVSPIIAKGVFVADGFIKTGNVPCDDIDSVGDAAAMAIEEFLLLKMTDGVSLINHIEQGTELAKRELKHSTLSFETMQMSFLKIKHPSSVVSTSSNVKQVFFPVPDQNHYHLLSILTNSPYVFALRNKIRDIKFSEETKQAKIAKKNNEYSINGYKDISNLTVVSYGGTKPANISKLNSNNAGKVFALQSTPPQITKRKFNIPKHDFFDNCVYLNAELTWLFKSFQVLINKHISGFKNQSTIDRRNALINAYIDHIIRKVWQIRLSTECHSAIQESALPKHHKQCLLGAGLSTEEDDWLEKFIDDAARHFVYLYERSTKKKGVLLGHEEQRYIGELISKHKEAFL